MKIGPLELGGRPCVAVAIQGAVPLDEIRAAGDRPLLIELRADALRGAEPASVVAFAENYRDYPLLATIRHGDEGGGWRGTEAERLACYRALLPIVDAVDVEIESGTVAATLAPEARAAGRVVIGSFHDFEATPGAERLAEVYDKGRSMGADIVKVAARCRNAEDLRRLAAFTLARRHENVVVIGMGEFGLASRIFFPALGSLITYTFLGAPTAPGQLNYQDTLKYLDAFYPASN